LPSGSFCPSGAAAPKLSSTGLLKLSENHLFQFFSAVKADDLLLRPPYSAYERGGNENANKLLRRFVPKGMDIGQLKESDLRRIERWRNNYPRRRFGYKSANDMKNAA
jgi:IS30 family transposase